MLKTIILRNNNNLLLKYMLTKFTLKKKNKKIETPKYENSESSIITSIITSTREKDKDVNLSIKIMFYYNY